MDGVVHGNLSRFRKFLLFSSIHTERSILANPSKPHISVKLCALCPACMTGPSYLLSFSNASIHHLGNVADGWSSQRCTEYKGRQLCSPAFVTSASSEGWGESHSQRKLSLVPNSFRDWKAEEVSGQEATEVTQFKHFFSPTLSLFCSG